MKYPSSERILRKKVKKINRSGATSFISGLDLKKSTAKSVINLYVLFHVLMISTSLMRKDSNLLLIYIIQILITVFSLLLLKGIVKPSEIILPIVKNRDRRKGQIFLGRIISNKSNNKKFLLNEQDLKKHVFITGLTGMGKTNLVHVLLKQLSKEMKEIPFLLTEFKGEYSQINNFIDDVEFLKPGVNFTINIFDPIDENPKIYAEKLLKMLISGQLITFSEDYSAQMEKVLVEILSCVCSDVNNRNWDGFDHYADKIREKYKKNMPYLNQTLISINNRLRKLRTGSLNEIFCTNPRFNLKEIIKRKVVLDLSPIIRSGGDMNDIVFFANVLFNVIWLDNLTNGKSESIRHFTIIEDAVFYSSVKKSSHQVHSNYLEDMALLLRGTGECLISINTRPTISEDIMANAGVNISFQISFDQDIVGRLLALGAGQFNYLTKIDVGECLVKVNSIKSPFLMKIPEIKVKKKKEKKKNLKKKNNQNITIYKHEDKEINVHLKKIKKYAQKYTQKCLNLFNSNFNKYYSLILQLNEWIKMKKKEKMNKDSKKYSNDINQNNLENNTQIGKIEFDCQNTFKKLGNKIGFREVINEENPDIIKIQRQNVGENPKYIFNKEKIPLSKWNEALKNAENLYLIGQNKFAYFKCEELFDSILDIFVNKWNLNSIHQDPKYVIKKIESIIPTFGVEMSKIYSLKSKKTTKQLSNSEIETFISRLKGILLNIKIKNSNNGDFYSRLKNKKIGNHDYNNEKLLELNNNNRSEKNSEEFNEDLIKCGKTDIWNILREAILNFEQQ